MKNQRGRQSLPSAPGVFPLGVNLPFLDSPFGLGMQTFFKNLNEKLSTCFHIKKYKP